MSDLVFLLIVIGGFALLRLAVAGIDHLVGRPEATGERP
jgi:hypothetical protein